MLWHSILSLCYGWSRYALSGNSSYAHKTKSKEMVLLNNKFFMSEFELDLRYSWCPHGLFFSDAFVYLMKITVMDLSL